MTETRKLSVENVLNQMRADDAPKSRSVQRDEEMDALDEEVKWIKAQRLRIARRQLDQRKSRRRGNWLRALG